MFADNPSWKYHLHASLTAEIRKPLKEKAWMGHFCIYIWHTTLKRVMHTNIWRHLKPMSMRRVTVYEAFIFQRIMIVSKPKGQPLLRCTIKTQGGVLLVSSPQILLPFFKSFLAALKWPPSACFFYLSSLLCHYWALARSNPVENFWHQHPPIWATFLAWIFPFLL